MQLNLEYTTTVVAPTDGFIANVSLHRSVNVNAYQILFALIEDKVWRATANFKKRNLQTFGQAKQLLLKLIRILIKFFLDMFRALAEDSETSFPLLSPENASENWVNVTQRFSVKIIIT